MIHKPQSITLNIKSFLFILVVLFAGTAVHAAVTVSNVSASQRPGTKLIDITYDVASEVASKVTTSLVVSNGTAAVSALSLTGAIGTGVATGIGKRVIWNMGADWNGNLSENLRVSVTADDGIPAGMVLIPGGTNAGTNPLANGETYNNFYPQTYSLTVSAFYMDKYEVTKALWDEVYTWAVSHGYSFNHAGSGKAASHPVHTVSWYDVVKWCNARSEKEGRAVVYTVNGAVYKTGQADNVVQTLAVGYRLPTDVEWEYAARGGVANRRFPWGDPGTIQHARANYHSSSSYAYDTSPTRGYHPTYQKGSMPYTSPVASFTPSENGLYDMEGNVLEWCFNWLPGYVGSYRVACGGGWGHDAYRCRVGDRGGGSSDLAGNHLGFRAVLSLGQ